MLSNAMINSDPNTLSYQDWISYATKLKIRTELFIDGQYVAAKNGETFDSVNPANGKVIVWY